MKNAINYFYNLIPNNIRQNKEEYFFEAGNKNYLFQECNRSDEELYELYNLEFSLYKKNIYFHQIVLNNNNDIITVINKKKYILLRIFNNDNKRISLNEIIRLSNIKIQGEYMHIKRNDWRTLWSNKIDYIEYIIEENKLKYRDFSANIDYFIGLVENAIQLLEIQNDKALYIAHQRINSNMKIRELYNPLNIILDNKERDVCEYFKDALFKKNDVIAEIFSYIEKNNLSYEELYYFFVRFLYLTRYFDLFDNVFMNSSVKTSSNEIIVITNEIERYEKCLKTLYIYLYSRGIIQEIEWLKKTSNDLF